jgi:hypothetical protein
LNTVLESPLGEITMHISKRQVSTSIAALFVAAVAAENFVIVQAQPKGYIQADCPNIVKQAIDTVSAQCGKTARGKLCYGNSNITTQFQPGANSVQFSAPGDTVDVNMIKQFTLGGMDTTNNVWGVAEMKIKADLPDADPTQAVTMILFGDVQLTDAAADANAELSRPTPTATAVSNPQATRIAATATGIARLEATATAHALTPTPTGTISAVKATQSAATATKLAGIEQTATAAVPPKTPATPLTLYSGLQAFYFQSKDTAPCDQAPHDGILIQSPQDSKQRVTLNIDGATISLGSTVYITAQPGKFMTIYTLEGSAIVTAAGRTQTADTGVALQVPLDANLRAAGVPVSADYFGADPVRALPTAVLPAADVVYVSGLPGDLVFSNWNETHTWSIDSGGARCQMGTNGAQVIRLAYNQSALWAYGLVLPQTGGNSYYYVKTLQQPLTGDTITNVYSLSVVSPTHISGSLLLTDSSSAGKCVFTITIDMTPKKTP